MVAELAALWDQDGGYDPAADLTRNRLNLNAVGDTTAVSGELVGEAALTVSEVIERETDKLRRRYQHDHDHEQAPELEIPSRATAARPGPGRRSAAGPMAASRAGPRRRPHPHRPPG